jgi:hypothetical protein
MKKNVLITLFALSVLSLMSCGTEAVLKENEVVVDTTQFELVPKLDIESIMQESTLSNNFIAEGLAKEGIEKYVAFANHNFGSDPTNPVLFSGKIPTYHLITIGALDTFVRVFRTLGTKTIAIAEYNNKQTFDANNPFDIDCKLIFFGFNNNGQVVTNPSSQSSIFYLNDMKRCPPDDDCSNIDFPVK